MKYDDSVNLHSYVWIGKYFLIFFFHHTFSLVDVIFEGKIEAS